MCLLTLSSCGGLGLRVLSDKPLTVPAKWHHGASSAKPLDTALLPQWWKRFNDPVLNALIAGALTGSPDLRSALAKVTEYRARRGIERAGLFPSINTNTTGKASRSKNRDTNITTSTENYQTSLDASWQVDLFGKQQQFINAASADLSQIKENYYGAEVTLAADVATAYMTLRSAEAQLDVVNHSLGTRTETVQLTEWREQAGTGNALDIQQSISILEQARSSIPELKLTIAQTKNQLTLLSGQMPGSLDSLLSGHRVIPAIPNNIAMGIPAETLRQRPDVRAAERGVEAAFARKFAAQLERLPSLNLSGSLGIEALKAGRLLSPQATVASLLGSLTAPIFDAGRIQNQIIMQSEQERQFLMTYESTVIKAVSEVENALIAVQRYGEQLTILNKAVNAAREASTLSALQFKAGSVDLFISLEAQRTLLSLEQQQVTTTAQRANACIQLYKALGGGWTSR